MLVLQRWQRYLPILALAFCASAAVLAQGQGRQLDNSGVRPWVVIKGSLQDWTGERDTILADFDQQKDARVCAARLNDEEKDWTRWTYLVRRRSTVSAGGGRGWSQDAWEARHGLTPIAYQAKFDELTPKKYRPICVSGFAVEDVDRYAGVWAHRSGPAWVARHGLTSAKFQATFDALNAQGYQPICVNGYTACGEARYAAIWEKRPGATWEVRHRLTPAQYQEKFDALNAKGYRLVCLNGYCVDGAARYAAIWEKRDGPAWKAHQSLTAAQYKATGDTLKAQGYRPLWLSGYCVGGAARYAAIWEKRDGPAWKAHHDLTSAQYQTTLDTLKAEGYLPICVSGYYLDDRVRYAVIWEKNSP